MTLGYHLAPTRLTRARRASTVVTDSGPSLSRLYFYGLCVYLASPSPYGKFKAVIPQEPLTGSGLHDAVLVLDPYPGANFGHLLLVFFIDTQLTGAQCQRLGGLHLGGGECLHLALRRRCRNALEKLSRRGNYARRCEIHFLPVVFLWTSVDTTLLSPLSHHRHHRAALSDAGSTALQPSDHLRCLSEMAGFASCPDLLPSNQSSEVLCHHLRDNTRRCSSGHRVSLRSSCRMFEVCDQAVLISGGWNRLTGGTRFRDNLLLMYHMLRNQGFRRRNINIFFANGGPPLEVATDPPHKLYPSAPKAALRQQLRGLCETSHCTDSLFIYLNCPALSDGTALLWDLNADGLVEDRERYSVQELKADLAQCHAAQVVLLVDQSFSGQLLHALRHSSAHRNLLVFTSGKSNQYAFDDQLTRFWATQNDSSACTTDLYIASRDAVDKSSALLGEGEEGRIRTTLSGAPCDQEPPLSQRELRREFFGCQNLPTAVWLRELLQSSDSHFRPSPRDTGHRDREEDTE